MQEEQARIGDEIKAIYQLCTDKNSYEKSWRFANILLVHPKTVDRFSGLEKVEDYKVCPYPGNKKIAEFLMSYEGTMEERIKTKELLVFGSDDGKEIGKVIWYLRCLETAKWPSSRRWMINQEHWGSATSSLKENLRDKVIDFTGWSGKNMVERILADDW